MRPVVRWLAAALLLLGGCAPGPGAAATGAGAPLLVLASASLTDAFTELGDRFARAHPEADVRLTFAGSQVLARQIGEGAPGDVFASADRAQMAVVVEAGAAAGEPEVFAGGTLAIAVEPGNPRGVTGLADLADPDLVVVLPAEAVPAGRYARTALDAAGVAVAPASLEQDVRAALGKVALGEADAAVVYASDVAAAAERVDGVAIPAEHNVTAAYPIVALADAPNPTAAAAFLAFVRGPEGRRVLAAHGFTAP